MKWNNLIMMIPVLLTSGIGLAQEKMPGFVLIPAGTFEMGDHQGNSPNHAPCPLHKVRLDAFFIGIQSPVGQ